MEIGGCTVLLTGATGGLGQAIARALAQRGASLVLSGRRVEVLAPLASELGARTLAADLALAPDVERLAADAGPVDILVANAALPASGRLDSYSVDQIDRALNVNLRAPAVLARVLLPGMVERGRGHMVFMSSLAGKAATPSTSLYNATKFGLRGFATALRGELRNEGIGVSTVFPGFIRDAGMFADANVSLPPGVGTRSPDDVARAVVKAIERNRGELDVAPLPLRATTLLGGVAPELAGHLARRLGAEELTSALVDAQREKR
jgi:short-subunit dehydrogenase